MTAREAAPRTRPRVPPPLPRGDQNMNPEGLSLLELLREDFRTHDRKLGEPGFWAVALHRFGNWRMGVRPRVLRAPLSLTYKSALFVMDNVVGIKLEYTVKLGRRVRIWHHGGMILGAREIGDDVHLRQNTTLGVLRRGENSSKPVIGARVDVGAGACILGDVHIGEDSVVGANAVVVKEVPPQSLAVGVPAEIKPRRIPTQKTIGPDGS